MKGFLLLLIAFVIGMTVHAQEFQVKSKGFELAKYKGKKKDGSYKLKFDPYTKFANYITFNKSENWIIIKCAECTENKQDVYYLQTQLGTEPDNNGTYVIGYYAVHENGQEVKIGVSYVSGKLTTIFLILPEHTIYYADFEEL